MTSQGAMTDRPRHGISFIRTRTMQDDDDEPERMPLSVLLAMPKSLPSQVRNITLNLR